MGSFRRSFLRHFWRENFAEIRYPLESGLRVRASVEGALFSMEDQRNYADTSYKAYAPLPYAYPAAPAGLRFGQTLTLEVTGAMAGPASEAPFASRSESVIRLGGQGEGRKSPQSFEVGEQHARGGFLRDQYPA